MELTDVQTRQFAELLAKDEIRDLFARYSRGVDRRDWDLVRSCYHPDAYDRHGVVDGTVDEFVAWLAAAMPVFTIGQHVLGNSLIEIEGDTAHCESYVTAYHRIPSGDGLPERDFLIGGRYIDRIEQRDGGPWKISDRAFVFDWDRTDVVEHVGDFPLPDTRIQGVPGRGDAVYRVPAG